MMPEQSDTVLIAKFFGLKGKDALEAIRSLTAQDKTELAAGIRDGSLTY